MSSSPSIPFPTLSPPQAQTEADSTTPDSVLPDKTGTQDDEPRVDPAPDPESTRILDEATQIYESTSAEQDELRASLGKLIDLCRTLTSRLSTLEPQITELQTTLTLTQSNLTLSLANTEMLEDALRTNAHTRDVGWRRSDSTVRRPVTSSMSYPSSSSVAGIGGDGQANIVVHAPTPVNGTTTPTPNESRFFKFRFGSKTPSPTTPAYPHAQPAHLASASLPSLGLPLEEETRARDDLSAKQESLRRKTSELEAMHTDLSAKEEKLKAKEEELRVREEGIKEAKAREKELEEVKALLEAEKKAGKELEKEKSRVEEEIETLTQSLFEEMVADERRRAAEVEALLKETEEERDAVRGAMRVVEGENGRLRELSAGSRVSEDSPRPAPPLARPPTPPSPTPEANKAIVKVTQEEADETVALTQDEVDPTIQPVEDAPASPPVNGVTDDSTEDLSVEAPPLPTSSPDPWKSQAQIAGSLPRTPPRVHALPTETSPWAEGRA
ncbi:hypothetical protein BDV93DRAFT_260543 [Ceratobasidium sp. AG-I]|nr:hypothetical protein BDV93DRAFT_260543 [Ceratobasidium sp. AG-I]